MVRKVLNNSKGSTFVMVLMALSVLSILGTVILSVAASGYKMKMVDKNVKNNFYLAEAGLDEAYTLIGEFVEEAMTKAKEEADTEIENIMDNRDDEEYKDFFYQEDETLPSDAYVGMVKEDMIKEKFDKVYKKKYKELLNEKVPDGSMYVLEEMLEDTNNYEDLNKNVTSIDAKIIKPFNLADNNDTNMELEIRSRVEVNNVIKSVSAKFEIEVPDSYDSPYYVTTSTIKMKNNVLFSKALIAEGDIVLEKGSKAVINGDIYAKGNTGGGIIVKSGDLTVNGAAITGENISSQCDTASDNANIQLNGSVYCNNMTIPFGSVNSNITVGVEGEKGKKFNVFVKDDMELGGYNSTIKVFGSYFGFSDGSYHSESSAIMINDPNEYDLEGRGIIGFINDYLGKKSFIKITGEKASVDTRYANAPAGSGSDYEIPEGIIIAGTSYIDDNNPDIDIDYQTGESISIKGNYVAYVRPLDLKVDDIYEIDKTDGSYLRHAELYDPDNIELTTLSPFTIATEFKKVNKYDQQGNVIENEEYPKTNQIMMAKDKGYLLIYSYNKLKSGEGSIKNIRTNGIELTADRVVYSTGAYIGKDKNGETKIFNDKHAYLDSLPALRSFGRQYKYFINRMGDPEFTVPIPEITDSDDEILDEHLTIAERFDFSKDIEKDLLIEGNEIFYKGGDGTITLLGDGASSSNAKGTVIKLPNNGNARGIIVTQGDIYIMGKVNFKGTIITEGSIYIAGSNTDVIIENDYDPYDLTNEDKNYVINKVYSDIMDTSTEGIGDCFVQDGLNQRINILLASTVEIPDKDVSNEEYVDSYQNPGIKYVHMTSWKRER